MEGCKHRMKKSPGKASLGNWVENQPMVNGEISRKHEDSAEASKTL